ncbi:MAG TPA: hypothetical protein VFC33_19065 [Acidimicrobiia bacterium]|nr:hypothetical protein [Acidimicrobiia bacterium]
MPVHRGKDRVGPFYQWGDHGKRYRYESGDRASRQRAKDQAARQGQAAHAHGYGG